MNRNWFLPLAVTALAALALADEPVSTPFTEGRLRQLERNQNLLHKLVQGGVSLAKADDRLQRARCCNDLVNSFADEIKQAAKDHDGDRALELGQHLHDLLERGVAGNLSKESGQIPGGSARMKDLKKLQNQATKTIGELETDLQNAAAADPENMQSALEAVQHGQVALADAMPIKARLRNEEGQAK